MSREIVLIYARAANGAIGNDGDLPWRLPADLKRFKALTIGKPMIMGRKTFDSFGGRPLPQRTNIVVTRDPHYRAEGAVVVYSIDEAIKIAGDAEELMVIGGASFYLQMLPKAERIYLTEVQGEFEGDAWFPEFDLGGWCEIEREDHPIDENNPSACQFRILERL